MNSIIINFLVLIDLVVSNINCMGSSLEENWGVLGVGRITEELFMMVMGMLYQLLMTRVSMLLLMGHTLFMEDISSK